MDPRIGRSLRIGPEVRRSVVYWLLTVGNAAVVIRSLQVMGGVAERRTSTNVFIADEPTVLFGSSTPPAGYLVLALISLITLVRERLRGSVAPSGRSAARPALRVWQFLTALPMLQVVIIPVALLTMVGVTVGVVGLLLFLMLDPLSWGNKKPDGGL